MQVKKSPAEKRNQQKQMENCDYVASVALRIQCREGLDNTLDYGDRVCGL